MALLALAGAVTTLVEVARASTDPVRLTVTAPDVVAARASFTVRVRVDADLGALDTRDGDVRLQVRLAPECGGDFLGTHGPTVIDARLRPQPRRGAGYTATASARARINRHGTLTVCAFLDDAEQRQFATDTDTQIDVSTACTRAAGRLTALRRALAAAQRAERGRHGASRARAARRVRALSGQERRQRRAAGAACHTRLAGPAPRPPFTG